jgi:hypothetical protein
MEETSHRNIKKPLPEKWLKVKRTAIVATYERVRRKAPSVA